MTRPAAQFTFAPTVDVWVGGHRVAASAPTWERVLSGEAVVEVVRQLGVAGHLTVAELLQGVGGVHRVAALQALRSAGIVSRRRFDGAEEPSTQVPAALPRIFPVEETFASPVHSLTDLLAAPVPAGAGPLLVRLEGASADALQIIDRHLGGSTAWIPLQLSGLTPWAGPLFGSWSDGERGTADDWPAGPCVACVVLRLRGRREVAVAAQADPAMHRAHVGVPRYHGARVVALLAELTASIGTSGEHACAVPSAAPQATGSAAPLWRAAIRRSGPEGLTWHPVPRGVCPACRTPIDPTPRSLMERLDRLSDPLTGCLAVGGMATPPEARLQVATAAHLPMARWVTLPPPTVAQLGESGRLAGVSSGNGRDRQHAQLAARMEALEGYAGLWRGAADGVPVRAAWSALPEGTALSPASLLAYSATQLRAEDPELAAFLDPDRPRSWWPAAGSDGRSILLPLALAYDGVPEAGARWWRSNGVAAGETRDAALAHALCELIERDATAIWWHNMVPRPRLPLPEADDTASAAIAAHQACGRMVALLDLTHDLAVAVRAAVTWDAKSGGGITMGFAADPDPHRASRRALAESCRLLPAFEAWRAGRMHRGRLSAWFATARLDALPWLLAGSAPAPAPASASAHDGVPDAPVTRMAHTPTLDGDPVASLRVVRAAITRAGMETWVIDMTRPDVGIPVVKAFVPGLRFRNRFAPGRLYDVPVALGWRAAPRTECDLLPFPDGLR